MISLILLSDISYREKQHKTSHKGKEKMLESFNRSASISITLPAEYGSIERLFTVNGRLLALTEKSIVEFITAEQIDTESKHLETRHHYQKLYSVGTSDPLIQSTLLFSDDYFKNRVFQKSFDLSKCKNHIWVCMEYLLKCQSALYKIFSSVIKLRPLCNNLIEQSKRNVVIPSLPQIDGLDDLVGNFLGNGKKFIEKTYEFLCLFLNCPHYGSQFTEYQKWLGKDDNHLTFLSIVDDFIEENRFISALRNAHSLNHPREGHSVEIRNFTLLPGNKFADPNWRYNLSSNGGKTQIEYTNLFLDFETLLNNMGIFFQSIFAECMNQVDITDIFGKLPSISINAE